MSEFTKGPWELWTSCSWRRFMSAEGRPVCVPTVEHDGHPDLSVKEADAGLMVSAPELYEALKYAVDNPEFDSAEFDRLARSALAKAEGKA